MPRRFLSNLIFIVFVFGLVPSRVEAKRPAPKPVAPVSKEGVIYSAPNENGSKAIVRATEAKSGKILWDKVIFTNVIRPYLEEDVQWRFIQELRLQGDRLLIIGEGWDVHVLDLSTRELLREPSLPLESPIITGMKLAICGSLLVWLAWRLWRRHRTTPHA